MWHQALQLSHSSAASCSLTLLLQMAHRESGVEIEGPGFDSTWPLRSSSITKWLSEEERKLITEGLLTF